MWHDPSLLIVGEPCKGKSNTAHTSDNFIFITQGQKHSNRIFSNDNLHAGRNIFPPSLPFFFFFFACSIHDVGERNYKLLPKFIHSLLLILPFLFLLLLLLFSFPLHFSSLPSSCLFCGVLFFFFLEREKETAKVWHCVSATDAFFSSPQGHSSNNDL